MTWATRPATFVLSGVTSARTYASSVFCSVPQPTHQFHWVEISSNTSSASSTVIPGINHRESCFLGDVVTFAGTVPGAAVCAVGNFGAWDTAARFVGSPLSICVFGDSITVACLASPLLSVGVMLFSSEPDRPVTWRQSHTY